jgi:hypothetical protein
MRLMNLILVLDWAPKFLVEGVVFQFNLESAEEEAWTKVKQVPKDLILATLDGSWRKEIRWKKPDAKVRFSFHLG